MKTVLILAPDFAPSSHPPALRVRFFANHLEEYGWQPVVLTVSPEYYETSIDPENERLVAASVRVCRTAAFSARWTRRFGLGDLGLRSLWQIYRQAKRLIREQKIDLIFIPVPPNYTMLLGRRLGRQAGIPYVVDYIDPWVIEDYWKLEKSLRPPKWRLAYYASRCLEPYSLKKVSAIVGVSKGTVSSVLANHPRLHDLPTAALPYGGEPADFDFLRQNPRKNPCFEKQRDLFYICYTGAFIPGMFPTAQALFRAMRQGLRDTPQLFEKIRFYFIGSSYAQTGERSAERLAREEGVGEYVTEIPNRIPYLDACQVLLSADALLAIGSDAPHYTASKIFPYILAQKPILAIFHTDSSVNAILRESGCGVSVSFNEQFGVLSRVAEIRERLGELASGGFERQSAASPDFRPYSAGAMARQLAALFDQVSKDRF